jgi:hypothetical protein
MMISSSSMSMEWNYVSELWPPTGLLFIPRWFMSMEEWYRQGKLLIRRPELSGNSTSSYLVAKQKELANEIINLAVRSNGSLTCRKILRHIADGFTSPPKGGVLRIFIALKSLWLSAGFEPANLGSKRKHANHYTTEDDGPLETVQWGTVGTFHTNVHLKFSLHVGTVIDSRCH